MLLLSTLVVSALGEAVQLTNENFDQVVFGSGKGAFVKFLAPWWGHCKSMKPDWDKLAVEFQDHPLVTIADVDCTTDEGKSVCSEQGVSGYPTIKFWTPEEPAAQSYNGGRTYDALKQFADETFKEPCNLETQENCSDDQKEVLDSLKGKKNEEIQEAMDKVQEEAEKLAQERTEFIAGGKKKMAALKKAEAKANKEKAILKMIEKHLENPEAEEEEEKDEAKKEEEPEEEQEPEKKEDEEL